VAGFAKARQRQPIRQEMAGLVGARVREEA